MMHTVWLIASAVALLGFLLTRFRPFLSFAFAFGAGAAAAYAQLMVVWQFACAVAVWYLAGKLLKPLFRALRRPADNPKALDIVGRQGKIRDVVNRRNGLFLLHCDGEDWVTKGETAEGISLGDCVQVVRVRGHIVIARRVD